MVKRVTLGLTYFEYCCIWLVSLLALRCEVRRGTWRKSCAAPYRALWLHYGAWRMLRRETYATVFHWCPFPAFTGGIGKERNERSQTRRYGRPLLLVKYKEIWRITATPVACRTYELLISLLIVCGAGTANFLGDGHEADSLSIPRVILFWH